MRVAIARVLIWVTPILFVAVHSLFLKGCPDRWLAVEETSFA
jgi:hypothetical protein